MYSTNLSNHVLLTGFIGKDPEFMIVNDKQELAKFSLAVNKRQAKDAETEPEPSWFNIIAWGKTAVLIEKHLEKGNKVMISGTLVSKSYKTTNDETRYSTEIVVQEFMKL